MRVFSVFHRSVGVNGRVNVTAPLTVQGSKDYFSVSVFTASRSCSLDSHFYLKASDPIAFDFQANVNSFLEGIREHVELGPRRLEQGGYRGDLSEPRNHWRSTGSEQRVHALLHNDRHGSL